MQHNTFEIRESSEAIFITESLTKISQPKPIAMSILPPKAFTGFGKSE